MPSPLVDLILQIQNMVLTDRTVGANLWSALVDQAQGLENELSTLKSKEENSCRNSLSMDLALLKFL